MSTAGERRSKGALDDEVVSFHDEFYIQVTSSRADDRTRVLKHGETFAVFDRFGDVQPVGLGEQGIYHDGTRFLSRLELRIGGRRPLLLSSTVKKENDLLTVDLSNPDLKNEAGQIVLPRGVVHVFRTKFLWAGVCYERLRVSNFGLAPIETQLALDFAADYADIFEVRGSKRERRGVRLEELVEGAVVTLGYQGLDGVGRRTRIAFDPVPDALSGRQALFALRLPPRQSVTLHVALACETDRAPATSLAAPLAGDEAFAALKAALARGLLTRCRVTSRNADLNEWIARSVSDLQMMITDTPQGSYPYAGVPWFSAPFGRDGIITALQTLWVAPDIARGVLSYLAVTQATEHVPERDAQPGKILHEARGGEMAALRRGSVRPLLRQRRLDAALRDAGGGLLAPHRRPALPALDRAERRARARLDRQGSGTRTATDSSSTRARRRRASCSKGGRTRTTPCSTPTARTPRARSRSARCRGTSTPPGRRPPRSRSRSARRRRPRPGRARRRRSRPASPSAFWDERLGSYVLALDGQKRPCRVRSSNAGHALWTGIADDAHARRVAETLMRPESFTGWGVRTIDADEARYNPMSYHNGSVWPHDNAIIAAGFARYGFRDLMLRLVDGMSGASVFVDLHRLPELFCGFPCRAGEGPTLYPVACAPQAWASAAVFMLLGAALGLDIDGRRGEISFSHPLLPANVPAVRIAGLSVGSGSVDLLFENHPHDVGLTVLGREGDPRVVIVK